jgi:hypothetical protein
VRESIAQRNFVSNEYAKAKTFLNEKKNKKQMLDNRLWDIEPEACKALELTPEAVKEDPEIARKLFFADVKSLGNSKSSKVRRRFSFLQQLDLQGNCLLRKLCDKVLAR